MLRPKAPKRIATTKAVGVEKLVRDPDVYAKHLARSAALKKLISPAPDAALPQPKMPTAKAGKARPTKKYSATGGRRTSTAAKQRAAEEAKRAALANEATAQGYVTIKQLIQLVDVPLDRLIIVEQRGELGPVSFSAATGFNWNWAQVKPHVNLLVPTQVGHTWLTEDDLAKAIERFEDHLYRRISDDPKKAYIQSVVPLLGGAELQAVFNAAQSAAQAANIQPAATPSGRPSLSRPIPTKMPDEDLWDRRVKAKRTSPDFVSAAKFTRLKYGEWIDAGILDDTTLNALDPSLFKHLREWVKNHPEDAIEGLTLLLPGIEERKAALGPNTSDDEIINLGHALTRHRYRDKGSRVQRKMVAILR